MSHESPGTGSPVQRIEADAVCEQCGTVNPEDTLLCKKCGNNLRDQRMRRVAAGGIEGLPRERFHPRLLRALLVVFGLLFVLWTAINVGRIEEWLVEGFKAADSAEYVAADFWESRDASRYEDMLQELDQNPATDEEIADAINRMTERGRFPGRYCIKRSNNREESIIGEALIREEGDTLYVVARIAPAVEIRGEAEAVGMSSLQVRFAGAKVGSNYLDIFGKAVWSRDGGYSCYGLAGPNDDEYAGVAYRVR